MLILIIATFGKFYIQISSLSTGLTTNGYGYMRFSVRLWLSYGSLRWTGAVWQSEPVHQLVRTHINQIFIYVGVYYIAETNEVTVSFLVQSGSEPISLI